MSLITKNKRAYFDYSILDTWEAWIELKWYEVKSIRAKQVNLKWSYISVINWNLYVKSLHISVWKSLSNKNFIETNRDRKIFLHKKNIIYVSSKIKESWFSMIPLELYFKWSLIKLKVALVKGRKTYQKKQVLKERVLEREAKRAMSKHCFY